MKLLNLITALTFGRIVWCKTTLAPSVDEYPFLAAIHRLPESATDISFDHVVCSGAIVSRTLILTSCSCLNPDNSNTGIGPSTNYYVTAGQSIDSTHNVSVYSTVAALVETYNLHPMCDKKPTGIWIGDIAYLKIKSPGFNWTDHLQPMKIPQFEMYEAATVFENRTKEGKQTCLVLGWSTSHPRMDKFVVWMIPMEDCVNPTCVPNYLCPKRNNVWGFFFRTHSNVSAIYTGGPLVCDGIGWGIVNLKKECSATVFPVTSPTELIHAANEFTMKTFARTEETLNMASLVNPQVATVAFSFFVTLNCMNIFKPNV